MLLGRLNHTSARSIRDDAIFRYREMIVKDQELAAYLAADAGLSLKHMKYLTDGRLSDKELKSVMKEAENIKQAQASPVEQAHKGGLSDFISEDDGNANSSETEDSSNLEDRDPEGEQESSSSQATLFQF